MRPQTLREQLSKAGETPFVRITLEGSCQNRDVAVALLALVEQGKLHTAERNTRPLLELLAKGISGNSHPPCNIQITIRLTAECDREGFAGLGSKFFAVEVAARKGRFRPRL